MPTFGKDRYGKLPPNTPYAIVNLWSFNYFINFAVCEYSFNGQLPFVNVEPLWSKSRIVCYEANRIQYKQTVWPRDVFFFRLIIHVIKKHRHSNFESRYTLLRYRSALTLGLWLVELNTSINIIVRTISPNTVIRMGLSNVDRYKMEVVLVTVVYIVQTPGLVTKWSSGERSENNRHRFPAGR